MQSRAFAGFSWPCAFSSRAFFSMMQFESVQDEATEKPKASACPPTLDEPMQVSSVVVM